MSTKVTYSDDAAWYPHHVRYAEEVKAAEDFARAYHISPTNARVIAAQTKIIHVIPKYPEIYLLLGTYLRKSWSRFGIPENYLTQQAFTSYIAPSLGPPERQEVDIQKIDNFLREVTDENVTNEGLAIAKMLQRGVKENNESVRFILERMQSFIPV